MREPDFSRASLNRLSYFGAGLEAGGVVDEPASPVGSGVEGSVVDLDQLAGPVLVPLPAFLAEPELAPELDPYLEPEPDPDLDEHLDAVLEEPPPPPPPPSDEDFDFPGSGT